MTTKRWWDVAFAGALTVLALIIWLDTDFDDTARIGGVATLAVMGAIYAAFGRRAFSDGTSDVLADPATVGAHSSSWVASVALRAVIIVGAGVGAAFTPNMATFQAIAFPVIWAVTDAYLRAVVLSGILAISVGIGLYISLGADIQALLTAVTIQGISFTFAVALGTWITRIADEGQKQRRLFRELVAAQDELATMHRETGTVAERERLAREIHDTIAQSLTSLVMLAQRTRRELEVTGEKAVEAAATVDLIESTARDALTEARSLVASMARMPEKTSSLADTVHRLGERFEKETGIQLSVSVEPVQLGRELEVVLLRCTQEALANVRKHSLASVASVAIAPTATEVVLEVRDNGRGIADIPTDSSVAAGVRHGSPNTAEVGGWQRAAIAGFGIAGMRDRVGLVGGRLDVTSGPTGGTLVRVAVPKVAPGTSSADTPSIPPAPTPLSLQAEVSRDDAPGRGRPTPRTGRDRGGPGLETPHPTGRDT